MDQKNQPPVAATAPETPPAEASADGSLSRKPQSMASTEIHDLNWVLTGGQGLRMGWSLAIFAFLYRLFTPVLETVVLALYPAVARFDFSPATALAREAIPLLALLGAGAFVAHVEGFGIQAYYLAGPRSTRHFFSGMAAGFTALSALAGALTWGGWLRFGPVALAGTEILKYAMLWGLVFLLVGLFEEGTFRCYLQFTLARGIGFWWALSIVAVLCLDLLLRAGGGSGILAYLWLESLPLVTGSAAWGVYAIALLGLFPCFLLHLKKAEGSGFWQAAWVTSTFFGFVHLSNNGENWIGIFAASLIGFVFCVSVRLTGSAWWAIGCHTAWDWAETYFYGTADSGTVAQGHLLTANPAGSALMSGGTDGPEGSLLVLPIILLLLAAILALYGRRKQFAAGVDQMEHSTG